MFFNASNNIILMYGFIIFTACILIIVLFHTKYHNYSEEFVKYLHNIPTAIFILITGSVVYVLVNNEKSNNGNSGNSYEYNTSMDKYNTYTNIGGYNNAGYNNAGYNNENIEYKNDMNTGINNTISTNTDYPIKQNILNIDEQINKQIDNQINMENPHLEIKEQPKLNMDNIITGGAEVNMRIYKLVETSHKIDPERCKLIDKTALKLFKEKRAPILEHANGALKKYTGRTLMPKAQKKKYEKSNFVFKRTLHWGQLKLMLSEIEFLTYVISTRKTELPIYMIYIGAAAGYHIRYMSEKMFPDVNFILYDKNNFAIGETKNIKIHSKYFTDQEAMEWSADKHPDKYIIFCSDIRTEPTEIEIIKNMQDQARWFNIIGAEYGLFKFRLPFRAGTTEYFKGTIYFQPFAGQTSAETRLLVQKGAPFVKYSHTTYEEQMYYHNQITRKSRYKCDFGELDLTDHGIDNCYDCISLVNILDDYLKLDVMKIELRDLIKDVQLNVIKNKSNNNLSPIANRTIMSFDFILSNLLRICYMRCGKKNCQTCTDDTRENIEFD